MRFARSILWYLHLLVAATGLPLLGLLGYGYYLELEREADHAEATAHALSEVAAAGAADFVARGRSYLDVFTRKLLGSPLDRRSCADGAAADFHALHPEFASLIVVDAQGQVLCSTVGKGAARASVAAQDWFQRIAAGESFAVGRPGVSRLSGRWVVMLAHAVRNDKGGLLSVVAVAIDLDRYFPLPARLAATPGTVVTLASTDGTIVARSEDAEKWVGTSLRGTALGDHLLTGVADEQEYRDVDGVVRLCAFSPVAGLGWTAIAGVPTDAAFAAVRANARRGALAIALVVVIATGLALMIARLIAQRVRRAADSVRALAGDQSEARLAPGGPLEIDEVAEQFNRVLDVQARTEIALGESQKRLQALFDNIRDGILLVNSHAAHVDANPALCAMLGYTREEMLRMSLWDDVTPDLVPELGRLWTTFLAKGMLEGEIRVRRKDGSTIEVEYRAKAHFMPDLHLCSVREITERRRAEEKLARYTEHLKLMSRRLVEVQEDERRHLAVELHDRTGQNLTAINLHLRVIRDQMAPDAATLRARVDDAVALVGETVDAVRDVMADLRPPVLEDYGLLTALQWYAEIFSRRTGIVTEVTGEELSPRLSRVVETAMFRVAQEACTNVAKHAQATRVSVTIGQVPGTVRMTIADNGVGFVPANGPQPASGWGMVSMGERVEAVGGVLIVDSAPGRGTQIVVDVPGAPAPEGAG